MSLFALAHKRLKNFVPYQHCGFVKDVVGLIIEAEGLSAPVGALCHIEDPLGQLRCEAEVVGFRDERTLLLSLGENRGIERQDRIKLVTREQSISVGLSLRGRVLNARGEPIDDKGPLTTSQRWPLYQSSISPLARPRIDAVLNTGIRVIDSMITAGQGQRMGIFSGSGVGKSVLMGMMTRLTDAPIIVIGLIGERGREVQEFLERDLGPDGLRRAVVVVATSDESPCLRVKGAFTATAIAEFFRDQGHNVLLMIDSVSRVAYAQREIGLSIGEPPTTRGYPPSVFSLMPQLLERSGKTNKGSITGFYTVLVEGDDLNEPVSDTARAILDGHISLSRRLANRGHYPAVSVLQSVSRVMTEVTDAEHQKAANYVRNLLAAYEDSEDLINIGAYVKGSNPTLDESVKKRSQILSFLQQGQNESTQFSQVRKQLLSLANGNNEESKSAASDRARSSNLSRPAYL